MIDLKDLRENPDRYRDGARRKHMNVDVDALIALDARRREAQQAFESLKQEQNAASKAIGRAAPEERQAKIDAVADLKARVKTAEEQAKALAAELAEAALHVPQPPDADVPDGAGEQDNVVLEYIGERPSFDFEPKSHIDLAASLGLADFEAGVRLAGTRSYVLTGAGALLHNAVTRFAMDVMTSEHGFTAAYVPVLAREETLIGTGFFPAHREAVYHVVEDDLYLVGTGEVGLTGIHMGEVLDEADLPKRYVTTSTCFRREAGSYGKDTAGFYRVHQFDKVEQVVICKNDGAESRRWHTTMLGYAEDLLKRLDIPYRKIQCCAGDLGPKNADMIDLESYMPSRMTNGDPETAYGETHSASRLYDYQARRLNIRYKAADGKTHFAHTLNNTVIANPRILIPLLECHQRADGGVTIPEPLRPYMNGLTTIEKK